MISVVLPSYNEEMMIEKIFLIIHQLLLSEEIEHELIFVNDGSKDATWNQISQISKNSPCVKGITFSRNFGKEAAILAGLAYASGDCCVVMDCDLQHPPETIIQMYHLWQQGYEIVEGIKRNRGEEAGVYRISAKLFYKLISKVTNIDMSNASDFKLLDRKAVNVLLNMPERQPFFRALSSWIGFNVATVEFDVQNRVAGESKWSTKSLIKYALNNITSFSTFSLQIVTIMGIIFLVFSLLLGGQTLFRYFSSEALEGFTTVIILLLVMGSVIMISLGIVGYYISKIYNEVMGRPRYIVSKTVNLR